MVPIGRQFGITKRQSNAMSRGPFEQRLCRSVWHFTLKPCVAFRLIGHVPAREKSRQRKLWINDQITIMRLRLLEQVDHARHNLLAAIVFVDWPHLGATDPQYAHGSP